MWNTDSVNFYEHFSSKRCATVLIYLDTVDQIPHFISVNYANIFSLLKSLFLIFLNLWKWVAY